MIYIFSVMGQSNDDEDYIANVLGACECNTKEVAMGEAVSAFLKEHPLSKWCIVDINILEAPMLEEKKGEV